MQNKARDYQADQRVGDREPERDEYGPDYDSGADIAVGPGVVSVGYKRRAVELFAGPPPDDGSRFVADHTDHAGNDDGPDVAGRLRMNELFDNLIKSHESAGKNDKDDAVAGPALALRTTQIKSQAQRDRRHGIAGIMNNIGQQGHAMGETKENELKGRADKQNPKT